jgi:hypothetical protein
MEVRAINKRRFNLAGIIPTAGQPLDFNFPWHDSLIPIGHNYLAVEKAVFDCAMAGCDTIWIVCPKDMQPLIRYRLGDYVVDPWRFYHELHFSGKPKTREISIYYVAALPKDADRRDCLAWSILTGANVAYRVGRKLSRWSCPDKYFVAFPYGMYTPYYMGDHRSKIRSHHAFALAYEEKTYRDGLYLPFTFDAADFKRCRNKFRKEETTSRDYEGKAIPAAESYTGRYFTHDDVFSEVSTEEPYLVDIPWYYGVSNWEGLKKWLGSENKLDKPPEFLLKYNEWLPLGVDVEKEDKEHENEQ